MAGEKLEQKRSVINSVRRQLEVRVENLKREEEKNFAQLQKFTTKKYLPTTTPPIISPEYKAWSVGNNSSK